MGLNIHNTLILLTSKSIFIIYLISIYLFYAILVIVSGIISKQETMANISSQLIPDAGCTILGLYLSASFFFTLSSYTPLYINSLSSIQQRCYFNLSFFSIALISLLVTFLYILQVFKQEKKTHLISVVLQLNH